MSYLEPESFREGGCGSDRDLQPIPSAPPHLLEELNKAFDDALREYGPSKGLEAIIHTLSKALRSTSQQGKS